MASEFLQKQRGEFSSFWDREIARPARETYLNWKNQAVGYLGLGKELRFNNLKEKLMASRRVEAQPDPRMNPVQWEAQQRLIQEGLARSRRNTRIELLIGSGVLVALAIGYLELAGERTGTSANVNSQDNIRPSITAPAPAEAVEALAPPPPLPPPAYYISFPPTATFAPTLIFTETPTLKPTGTATATLSPEEARLAEIERLVAEFKIPAHREDFVIDASWILLTDRISPGNSRALDVASHAGFNPFIVGEPVVGKAPGGEDMVEVIGVYTTPHGNDWVRIVFGRGTRIIDGQRRKIAGSLETIEEIVDYINQVRGRNGQLGVAYVNSAAFGGPSSTGVFTRDSCTTPVRRACSWMFDVYVRGHESELRNFLPEWGSGNRITLPAFYVIEGGDRVGYFFTPTLTPIEK